MMCPEAVEMASLEGLRRVGSSQTGKVGGEEIPEWVVKVNEILGKGYSENSASSWSIYRVPERLRQAQESAFCPKLVSVGPFHLKDRKLEAMNEQKMHTLVRLLERDPMNGRRSEEHPKTTKLNILTKEMEKLEQKTRACYSEHFHDIPSDEFVRMMVVDGCFVVELLRHHHIQKEDCDDPIVVNRWMLRTIQRDLLMLENQLPFFILKKIFDLTSADEGENFLHTSQPEEHFSHVSVDEGVDGRQQLESSKLLKGHIRSCQGSSESINCPGPRFEGRTVQFRMDWKKGSNNEEYSFEELAISFFEPLVLPKRSLSPSKLEKLGKRPYQHLLDLFRHTFICEDQVLWKTELGSSIPEGSILIQEKYKQLMYPAMELEEAGVFIKKKKVTPGFDLLSIQFKEDGTLQIPPLYLDDYTVPMFLNFVAFEQCKGDKEPFFSNYFMFWDGLIDTEADVEILHRKGIMNHVLGSGQDVVALLNKVSRDIAYDQDHSYLYSEMKGLNKYCHKYYSSKLRNWWRKLLRDYFSSPWTFLSLVAAVILLVLTFLQTFYTMYGFHQPHDNDGPKDVKNLNSTFS